MLNKFLPVSRKEFKGNPDVVIVTGDAYIDHPAFGSATVGRLLETLGLTVAVLPQPDWHGVEDFKAFGRPNIFFGVTSGCVDSMIANYSPLKGRRKKDFYSPEGISGMRPDRACIVYSNAIHRAYKGSFIVLGGIEATTRRLAHYDYWDNCVRRSILIDSGANLIIYGPAEPVITSVVKWILKGKNIEELFKIRGLVFAIPRAYRQLIPQDSLWLPSFEDVSRDKEIFWNTHFLMKREFRNRIIVQPHEDRIVVQTPPSFLFPEQIDSVYKFGFTRRAHPIYKGEIPALKVVQNSITVHRGCFGQCTYCVLTMCQGSRVISRSQESIIEEVKWLAKQSFFDGVVTDVGGPTANMYKFSCRKNGYPGSCIGKKCLFPEVCHNLIVDHNSQIQLIRKLKEISGVRKVYISSGIRFDLVLMDPPYLDFLLSEDVVPGQLSVAPEHVSNRVLKLMGKPPHKVFEKFRNLFNSRKSYFGKDVFLLPYFISSFPGATLQDAFELGQYIRMAFGRIEQIQDFTPIPMSDAGCMYWTEMDFNGGKIFVAKEREGKLMQRGLAQMDNPVYRKWGFMAMKLLKAGHKL